jgi:hypothetical protein
LARQRRRCKTASCRAESSSRPTPTGCIENVYFIVVTNCSCATNQCSSPAAQSAPPSTKHTHHKISSTNLTSHHLAISATQNIIIWIPIDNPPANKANPWFGRDVAARKSLATLRTAVVQRPLVASKMSTVLKFDMSAQRISVHIQRLKARLLPTNTRPPTPATRHLTISVTQNKITYLLPRLRIWPILGSAVTSLQGNFLPR